MEAEGKKTHNLGGGQASIFLSPVSRNNVGFLRSHAIAMSYFIWLAILAGGGAIGLFIKNWLQSIEDGAEAESEAWEEFQKTLKK